MELILPHALGLDLGDFYPSLHHCFERRHVQLVTTAQTAVPPTPAAAQGPKPHHEVMVGISSKTRDVLLPLYAQSKHHPQGSSPCCPGARPLWTGHLPAFNPVVTWDSPSERALAWKLRTSWWQELLCPPAAADPALMVTETWQMQRSGKWGGERTPSTNITRCRTPRESKLLHTWNQLLIETKLFKNSSCCLQDSW